MRNFFTVLTLLFILLAITESPPVNARNIGETTGEERHAMEETDFLYRATKYIEERAKTDAKAAQFLKIYQSSVKANSPPNLQNLMILQAYAQIDGDVDALPCYPGEADDAIAKRVFKCNEAKDPRGIEPKSRAKVIAWKSQDYVKYIYNNGRVQLLDVNLESKLMRSGELQKSILISMLPASEIAPYAFRATATDIKDQTITASFKGQCAALVRVDVTHRNPNPKNEDDSKKLDELPIGRILDAMKLALQDQCADLAGFQIYYTNPFAGKTRLGSMLAENGWKIRDGVTASKNESELVVDLNVQIKSEAFSGGALGTVFKGKCEINPTLPFGTFKGHYLDVVNADTFSMNNHMAMAERVAKIYAAQCPSTQAINFKVTAELPDRYECLDKAKCISVTKEGGWKADTSGMKQMPLLVRTDPLDTKDCAASDMFCNLTAGDYLNAIYESNGENFFAMDEKYTEGLRDFIKNSALAEELMPGVLNSNSNTFPTLITNYIYLYGEKSKACLRKDHLEIPKIDHVPESRVPVMNGDYINGVPQYDTHVTPGYDITSTAFINKEFEAACNRFCRAGGRTNQGNLSLTAGVGKGQLKIVQGLEEMMSQHACDSQEIKKFERNLLHLFQQIYIDKTTSSIKVKGNGALPKAPEQFAELINLRNKNIGTLLVHSNQADLYSSQISLAPQSCTLGKRKVKIATQEYQNQIADYDKKIAPIMEKRNAWSQAFSQVKDKMEREAEAASIERSATISRTRSHAEIDKADQLFSQRMKDINKRYAEPLGEQPTLPPKPAMPEVEVPILYLYLAIKNKAADVPILQTIPKYEKDKFPLNTAGNYYFLAPEAAAELNQKYFSILNQSCPQAERLQVAVGFDDLVIQSRTNPNEVHAAASAWLWFHKSRNGDWKPEKNEIATNDFEDPKFSRELTLGDGGLTKQELIDVKGNNLKDSTMRLFWLREEKNLKISIE